MVSKTLRTRRNRISKSKRISGGKKGDVHAWNLGVFTIKKREGYVNDTYWIECPDDPLPDGWKLLDTWGILRTEFPMYVNLTGDKELYPGIGADKSLYWSGNYTRYRPLLEPVNQKMTQTEYIKKLRTTEWKQIKQCIREISGLKDFIKKTVFNKISSKELDPGQRGTAVGSMTYTYYYQWVVNSEDCILIYNLIKNFNEADVPVEFKKLYTTVRDWNFEKQRDSLF